MKKITIALLFSLLFACQKNDPCENITCLNGGACANGLCNCEEGYTGSDCSQEKTPSSITITAVTVTKWPATAAGGGGWDLLDGPDLTFSIRKDGADVYVSGIFYEDAIQGQQYRFQTNIVLDSPDKAYQFLLYDYDDFDANDLMAQLSFVPFIEGLNFPPTGQADSGALAFELDMQYDFN